MVSGLHQIGSALLPLSRRGLLKGCIATGTGVAAMSLVGCSQPSPTPFKYLDASGHAVIKTLSRIMFPASNSLFPVSDIDISAGVDHLLSQLDPDIRGDVGIAISLFDYGATVLGWHFSRFSSLNDQDATEYVDRWQSGNDLQRGIATTLKKLVYTAYWQDSRTWKPVAFDGPVSDQWGLEKLGNTPMPVTEGETHVQN